MENWYRSIDKPLLMSVAYSGFNAFVNGLRNAILAKLFLQKKTSRFYLVNITTKPFLQCESLFCAPILATYVAN